MRATITFNGYDVIFENEAGKYSLSPYFYYVHNQMIVGSEVNRAIDLYPMSIRSVYEESDASTIAAYLQALHLYMIHRFIVSDYVVQVDAQLMALHSVIKQSLPNFKIHKGNYCFVKKLPNPWNDEVRDAMSTIIAAYLVRTGQGRTSLYNKLKRIVHLRINFHLKALLYQGETRVQLKIVDPYDKVHTVRERVGLDIPALQLLVQLYKQPSPKEDAIVKALYGMADEHFKVTFISPFSFGKSTLINSLLGEKLLKMDIRAETAIVTKVVSADSNRLYVKYSENRFERHTYNTYEELRDKLAGLTGVHNGETPLEIQICHTLGRLPGVAMIDAPGLNSRHTDHNEKALDAFRISDLVLFLINPAHIGEANFSKQMKEFLDTIAQDGTNKRYGFVLSKLDLYSDDYEVIMNELDIVLRELDPDYSQDRVFFVSGYFGLIGKLMRDGNIPLSEVRKSHGVFVLDQDDIISGRALEQHHALDLLQFSQIGRLEQFIQERGEKRDASSKRNLGDREQKTVGHAARA